MPDVGDGKASACSERVYSPPEVDRIWGIRDLIMIQPKPYSVYLRWAIGFRVQGMVFVGCIVSVWPGVRRPTTAAWFGREALAEGMRFRG